MMSAPATARLWITAEAMASFTTNSSRRFEFIPDCPGQRIAPHDALAQRQQGVQVAPFGGDDAREGSHRIGGFADDGGLATISKGRPAAPRPCAMPARIADPSCWYRRRPPRRS